MFEGALERLCRFAVVVFVFAAALASGQESELSHVERFTDPKVKLERAERDATARLDSNPRDARAFLGRGVARLSLGELKQAVTDLREAAELDPKSAEARAQLAYGLWLLGALPEALVAARAALALNPDNASAHYYAGRILLDTVGDPEQALKHLQRAVELNPDQIDLRFDLLNAYRRRGDLMRAGLELRLLRTALPPSDPRVPYAEGLLAADLGQLVTATDRFRRALQANPRFVPARYDLARALVQAERWQEALQVAEPLANEYPQSYTAAYLHALALQNSQRAAEAEKEARRATALEPKSADAYTLLGITLASRGAHTDAVAALETASGLDPKSFDAQFYLGRARYALRDLAQARDAFRAATSIKPEAIEARFFLATALEGLGESDAAQAQYRELIERHPQDPQGYIGLGNLQAKHGENDAAMASLRRAHELDPKNFEATLNLGRVLARAGQLEPAIALLREAAEMAPESAEAHYQLGLALRRGGHEQEAKKEFAIVERLNQQYRGGSGSRQPPPPPPEKNYILELATGGVALFDYDGDGWLDVYLVNGSTYAALKGLEPAPRAALFHNNHDGTFTDVTAKAGVSNDRWGFGVAVGDYNNDGWPDLYVTNFGKNRLYRNNGDATFTDVAEQAGVAVSGKTPIWTTAAAFGDYDRDGNLDLFVAGYLKFDPDHPPVPGSPDVGRNFCEYRGQTTPCGPRGLPGERDFLFHNNGRVDLYVTNFSDDYNPLYHNEGGGNFLDITFQLGLGEPTIPFLGWGAGFIDYDNDGRKDIFVANGHVYRSVDKTDWGTTWAQPPQLFRNLNGARFQEVPPATGSGLAVLASARGAAFGDIFNDGHLDVVMNNLDGPPTLLRNVVRNGNHWLLLKLIGGPKSPRDATGALAP